MTKVVSLRKSLSIPKLRAARISQNGRYIAYSYSQPNFKKNEYQGYLYYYDTQSKTHHVLSPMGNVSQFEWFNESNIIALKALEGKTEFQLFLFDLTGEPIQLTEHKDGITSFKITPNGIVFLAKQPEKEKVELRNDRFGGIIDIEQEISQQTLYYLRIEKSLEYLKERNLRTEKEEKDYKNPIVDLSGFYNSDWHIKAYEVTSNGIVLQLQEIGDMFYLSESEIHFLKINLDATLDEYLLQDKDDKKKLHEIIEFKLIKSNLHKGIELLDINNDELLFSHKFRDDKFYTQNDLTWVHLNDLNNSKEELEKQITDNKITGGFDRDTVHALWLGNEVLVWYPDFSTLTVMIVNKSGEVRTLDIDLTYVQNFKGNGKEIVIIGSNTTKFLELYYIDSSNIVNQITNNTIQIADWELGTTESIRWKAGDGLEIEGVLRKPTDFDPSRKYPLLLIVHGGPAWLSPNTILTQNDLLYYPAMQFIQKGFLVLYPNYRGSIGRGQNFKEIYKDNMGYAEMDDIHSGIEYLISQGFVDESRIGCMGWSQGGYISAFLATHSNKFKAISMGAGISNWTNYYIANDIRQWTLHYLSGDPYDRAEYYLHTAPVNKIREAKTPLLIQHGEKDERVPVSNGYEMYRALFSQNVPTRMFVFKGMPHSITKPKENLAVIHQNYQWFCHYLLGEDLKLMDIESLNES